MKNPKPEKIVNFDNLVIYVSAYCWDWEYRRTARN
tara:strand:- start:613 stop:717 length:105 start_codon:yes stop_codon:yes gene_type:complete